MNIKEAVNQFFEKLTRHLESLEQERNTLPGDNYLWNVPTNRWISVHDRMPDKDDNYIVTACDEDCFPGEGIWYSTVVVVAEYYNGSWTWYDGGHEYSLDGIVTHWMQMPEMPETEKAEE